LRLDPRVDFVGAKIVPATDFHGLGEIQAWVVDPSPNRNKRTVKLLANPQRSAEFDWLRGFWHGDALLSQSSQDIPSST
jgi:hypothetical protein